jgi:hypothetical protein
MKLVMVHFKNNEPIRIRCDSYRLNNDNKYEFFKDGALLTQYNFSKSDVVKIDDPPKLATGFRHDKPRLR